MGIDPSINCTGICIYDTVTNTNSYYIITSKSTKKLKELSETNPYINVREYYKMDLNNTDYKTKEYNKSKNLAKLYNISLLLLIATLLNIAFPPIVKLAIILVTINELINIGILNIDETPTDMLAPTAPDIIPHISPITSLQTLLVLLACLINLIHSFEPVIFLEALA